MPKVNNFDVMKAMCASNGKIQIAPLGNILSMRKTKKGTQLTIGVAGDVIMGMMAGEYVGGLILCDRAEFEETARAIEANADRT